VEVKLHYQYQPPKKIPRKEPKPPIEEAGETSRPTAEIGNFLPSGEFSFKYPLDPKIGYPAGPYAIIYPSGEISGTFKLKTGRPETIGGFWKQGKLGFII
jgi:hypothetical protein